jgi:hypothetical protein
VGGPADDDAVAEDPPGHRHRQVVLAQVQHRRAGRQRDVGPVVDGPQLPVALRGGREHLQQPQLVARLEALLAQLHHVHPARQRGVEEVGQVAPLPPPIGAQVEAGVSNVHERPGYAPPRRTGYGGARTGAR